MPDATALAPAMDLPIYTNPSNTGRFISIQANKKRLDDVKESSKCRGNEKNKNPDLIADYTTGCGNIAFSHVVSARELVHAPEVI